MAGKRDETGLNVARTTTEIQMINGAPTLCLNGEPVPALAYFRSGCGYAEEPRIHQSGAPTLF